MKFLKGSRDEFEKLKDESSWEDKAEIIQRQMAEVFGSKNLSFLMGSGCSSLRHDDDELGIPTMKFLAEEFQALLAADADAGQAFVSAAQKTELYDKLGIDLYANDVKGNLEQMIAVLINAHQFCKTSDKEELSAVAPLVESIIVGIKKFVLHKCATGPFSNGDESIVALYRRFYQSLATRARGLARLGSSRPTTISSMNARWIVQVSRTRTVSRERSSAGLILPPTGWRLRSSWISLPAAGPPSMVLCTSANCTAPSTGLKRMRVSIPSASRMRHSILPRIES